MTLDILKKSLSEVPIIKKGEYHYLIHPLTDCIPLVKTELLEEVVSEIYNRINKCGKIDKIVTMEAMGIHIATGLSLKMKIPFTVIRKKEYGLSYEINVEQVTGYSKNHLFINGLKKGDEVVIIDDVLSTGGTLRAVLSALKKIEVNVKGVFIVIDKGKEAEKIMDELNVFIESLVKIDIVNGKVMM